MALFAHWQCASLMIVAGLMACGSAEPGPAAPTAGTGGAGSSSTAAGAGSGGSAAVGGTLSGGAGGVGVGGAGSGGTTAGTAAPGGGTGGSAGATAGASGSAAGGGGSSGSSGAGAGATKFCSDYQTHCGFGAAMRYTSSSDCTTKYASWTATRQMCIETHLGFVSAKMGTADYESYKTMHCPHAMGTGPCAAATP